MWKSGIYRGLCCTGLCFGLLGLASPAGAQQQQTGTGNAAGNANGGANAAAADAGQRLTSQNLFSTAGDSVGEIGSNQGRFAANQLQNAPVASGNGQTTTPGVRTTSQFRTGRNTNRGGTQNRFGQGNTGSSRSIRPSLRLGFTPPQRPSADVRQSTQRRLQSLTQRVARLGDTIPAFQAVNIQVDETGGVTLTGTVPSDRAARLAANILRMEAGVRSVDSRLTVAD